MKIRVAATEYPKTAYCMPVEHPGVVLTCLRAGKDERAYNARMLQCYERVGGEALGHRGIDGWIGYRDTFHNDRHPDLKVDYVLATRALTI